MTSLACCLVGKGCDVYDERGIIPIKNLSCARISVWVWLKEGGSEDYMNILNVGVASVMR